MSGSDDVKWGPADGGEAGRGPSEANMLTLGKLSFLASFSPAHQKYPLGGLSQIFIPAINHNCVRLFENEAGDTAAALIWARLSDEVSEKMLFDHKAPRAEDWNSGTNLWFIDMIAPFGHGRTVAMHIARNPPPGPFFFARRGELGRLKKVLECDASKGKRGMVRCHPVERRAA